MSDQIEDDENETAEAAREQLMHELRTRGVRAAYRASLEVAENRNAPAPARATASATLFRVAGYFNAAKDDDDLEPHEMTAGQLARSIAKLKKTHRQLTADGGADEGKGGRSGGGVFD